ncbi:hypothetical protein Tco_1372613 [Tanacetum coccineum]
MILSDADNRPPMLDKDLYDSWKSQMELYMQNRENGRMILETVENGPLIWPTVEENGLTRTKKYAELSAAEKIQADCDMKATNIILQDLPANIYSLQERKCKLYDAFDKFTHIKEETLHKYYLRFTQLINDMNIYNMKIEQFQVNTKFISSLPPEWSKFVTDVKLVKDLHTSNFDQLHAYLEQHELHANEVHLLRECNQYPLAFVANQQITPPHFNTYQSSYNNRFTVLVFSLGDDPIACLNKEMAFLTVVASSSYSGTGYKSNATSSGGNNASGHARVVNATTIKVKGIWLDNSLNLSDQGMQHDPGVPDGQAVRQSFQIMLLFRLKILILMIRIDISNAQAVLMANISNYGYVVISEVPHSETYLNDMVRQGVLEMQDFEQPPAVDFIDNEIDSDSNIIPYSQYLQETQQENEKANKEQTNESVTAELERYKERVKTFEQRLNIDLSSREKIIDSQIDDMIKEKLALKEQVDSLEQKYF